MAHSNETAAEFIARLQNDPEWVRQNAEREAKHKAAVEQLQKEVAPEQQPIIKDLLELGFRVNSVWDFVNTNEDYRIAIPMLTKYLCSVKHPTLRQGIARALTIPAAKGISGQAILGELKSCKDPFGTEARWALAHALTEVAEKSLHDEIRQLANDPKYSDVKERLLVAAKKSQKISVR